MTVAMKDERKRPGRAGPFRRTMSVVVCLLSQAVLMRRG